MLPYRKNLKTVGRDLRGEMTPAERVLWSRLRRKQIGGVQFYRPKPLADFVVDFYAPAADLVIEVDGAQHREAGQREQDRHRDATLGQLGLRVLRFANREVLEDTEAVVQAITEAVRVGLRPK
jgi:very-short-patch-repair endonuclease